MAAMTLGHQALYVAKVEGLELRVEGPDDDGRDDFHVVPIGISSSASASSMSSVGCISSITRKKAEGLMLEATTGRFTSLPRTLRRVVLPQRFTGDSTPRYVLTSRNLKHQVWMIQSASVSAACLGRT